MYAHEQGWIEKTVEISHYAGHVRASILDDGTVRTEMEVADFCPRNVPLAQGVPELFQSPLSISGEDLTVSALSTGSTHTILLVDELPDDAEFLRIGPEIENHPYFPQRTSAIWTKVVAPGHLEIRIWERGAGETMGCGTGSSAAAVVYSRVSGFTGNVAVHNPGGVLTVSVSSWDQPVATRATAEVLYRGTFRF
jgi:diaminopimelate epimerase